MQEDYFLNAAVDQSLVAQFADIIAKEQLSHVPPASPRRRLFRAGLLEAQRV
jgi:hypothetical protein